MKNIKEKYPSGDFAVWIIIYIELITFGALFVSYAYSRSQNVKLFNESQLLLDTRLGFINTLLLISASFFVVKAVEYIKSEKSKEIASRFILVAVFFGSLFLLIKVSEFAGKYAQGVNLSTNTFFMFYFILTIFHFLHVVLGVVILFNLYKKTKIGGYTKNSINGLESGANYWHMVDLLWIVLFPLIYVMR